MYDQAKNVVLIFKEKEKRYVNKKLNVLMNISINVINQLILNVNNLNISFFSLLFLTNVFFIVWSYIQI